MKKIIVKFFDIDKYKKDIMKQKQDKRITQEEIDKLKSMIRYVSRNN